MDGSTTPKRFSFEEKQQLLENLEIEIAHRTRRLEGELADALEKFLIRQEGQISRVPRLVRSMPLREFRDKYKGDIKAALRGLQMEKLGLNKDGEGSFDEDDKGTRKRKWIVSVEAEANGHVHGFGSGSGSGSSEAEAARGSKSARMYTSPKKKQGPFAQHSRPPAVGTSRTPKLSRILGRTTFGPSPTPKKPSKSFNTPRRPVSPTKPSNAGPSQTRPPSTETFAPAIPKTLTFPALGNARLPRRDEGMLSLNGSPLANPLKLGLGWFANLCSRDEDESVVEGRDQTTQLNGSQQSDGRPRLKKTKSRINVKRDPSSSSNSQSSTVPSTSSTTWTNSSISSLPSVDFKGLHTSSPSITALVSLPTSDGHLLEFDPLKTSPGQLEAVEGVTASAKQRAREEMSRLMRAAVEKWKIV